MKRESAWRRTIEGVATSAGSRRASPLPGSLSSLQSRAGEVGRLTPEEVESLIRIFNSRVEPHSTRALEKLMLSHMPLVMRYAAQGSPQIPIEDRVQFGFIGLLEAIKRYDISRGFRLATYASSWIWKEIHTGQFAGQPAHIKNIHYRRAELSKGLNRPPTDTELACALNLSPRELMEFADHVAITMAASLDSPWGPEENASLIDIAQASQGNPAATLLEQCSHNAIAEMLNAMRDEGVLSSVEADYVKEKFELVEPDAGMTRISHANRYGSLTQTRSLETQALLKIREHWLCYAPRFGLAES